ncbi:hypothetical protein E3E26_06975 [Thermococcus sp. LS1]|uniref:hypothetical protein n=1 Tax=Thermococcus sp. LS1 TaxID=1638259 RepID=UPI00143BBF65|nr:hypothetical protein [Thermococcus sp. LS1]NJD99526.1 hypothetical protein [Thermococcus sp. LS1]
MATNVNVPVPAFPSIHMDKRKLKQYLFPFIIIAIIAVAVAAGAAGYYLGSSGSDSGGGSETVSNYANTSDTTNDADTLRQIANAIDDANQEAYKKIAELNAMLRSDLTKYDITEEGATGDLWVEVYGPEKVYGFSAFPVQVKLYTKESNIPFSYVHIRSISIYIKEENSTVELWKRIWDYGINGSEGLNGESAVYSTILKVPDPLAYQVQSIITTGAVSKDVLESVFNTSTKSWEIYVDVDAYREVWQSDPSLSDQQECENAGGKWDSDTGTCYVFVRNADIDYHVQTTSAWKHVTRANDVALLNEGFYSSLPVKFLASDAASKWSLYQEQFAGAVSNFIILTYANPVHVMGSTADYKFYIAPNPGYFEPLKVNYTDDFRFLTVRVYKDGHWEVADSIFGNLGTLTDSTAVEKLLNAKYTEDPDALTYKVFGMAYFEIHRDDGITIPVWLVAKPEVSIIQNTRVVLDDTQIEQLTALVDDKEISEADLEQIRQTAQAWIDGINEKIANAKALKAKAEGVNNDKAAEYAGKAIDAYEEAISALQKLMQTDDYQMFLNWLNVAKKYEQAGDMYTNAAEKALYGEYEQAELDAKMAEDLIDLADSYKPGFSFFGGDLPFGLTWMDIIVLIIAAIVAWVGKQFFGPIGALFGLVVAIGWFAGKGIGIGLDWLFDKLKFW